MWISLSDIIWYGLIAPYIFYLLFRAYLFFWWYVCRK